MTERDEDKVEFFQQLLKQRQRELKELKESIRNIEDLLWREIVKRKVEDGRTEL